MDTALSWSQSWVGMGHCAWGVRSSRGFCSALAVGDPSQSGSRMDLWLFLRSAVFFFFSVFFLLLPWVIWRQEGSLSFPQHKLMLFGGERLLAFPAAAAAPLPKSHGNALSGLSLSAPVSFLQVPARTKDRCLWRGEESLCLWLPRRGSKSSQYPHEACGSHCRVKAESYPPGCHLVTSVLGRAGAPISSFLRGASL